MIRLNINGKDFKIMTEWSEVNPVTLSDASGIREELKCLSDIDDDILFRAEELQLFPLRTIISFIDEVENMPMLKALSVQDARYELFEIAKGELRQHHKPYRKVLNIAMLYYPEEKNTVRLIGLGLNIIEQIAIFLGNYEDMLHAEPESDEVNAGIDELSGFGSWGTAFVMAGKDPLKIKQILDAPTLLIYTSLYYNWKEAKYQKSLMEAKYSKHK